MNVDNSKKFTCLSLCSGYGGLELGLGRTIENLRTVAYVEVEAFAVANLVAKMEKGLLDAAPIWTDIKTFDGGCFRGKVDIITAGYPCQPFSVAGKRKGTDDPRHLWPYIERIIETVRPVWFFGENVSGHLALGFPEVYRSLRNMGYKVEAGLFTAAECGAPHRRERLFILAKSLQRWGGWGENLGKCAGRPTTKDKIARPSKLADTCTQRLQGQEWSRICGKTQENRSNDIARCSWPTRPRQPQYEWEEPRVVADTKRQRPIQSKPATRHRTELSTNGSIARQKNNTTKGQAQSRLGRATYGTSCRVDRLRLLGNGVVPQQAEKAFRYLIELFGLIEGIGK